MLTRNPLFSSSSWLISFVSSSCWLGFCCSRSNLTSSLRLSPVFCNSKPSGSSSSSCEAPIISSEAPIISSDVVDPCKWVVTSIIGSSFLSPVFSWICCSCCSCWRYWLSVGSGCVAHDAFVVFIMGEFSLPLRYTVNLMIFDLYGKIY